MYHLPWKISFLVYKCRWVLQRARAREPQKIAAFNETEVDESPKAIKKAVRLAEKEASSGKWTETISLDAIDHKRASNYFFQTLIEEPPDAEQRIEKAYFEELMELDLGPEITVR